MKYLKITLVGCWVFGIGINAAYVIPTSKVINLIFVVAKVMNFDLSNAVLPVVELIVYQDVDRGFIKN